MWERAGNPVVVICICCWYIEFTYFMLSTTVLLFRSIENTTNTCQDECIVKDFHLLKNLELFQYAYFSYNIF